MTSRSTGPRLRRGLALAIALPLLASACTSSSTPSSSTTATASPGEATATTTPSDRELVDNTAALEAVYAAVEGLTGEERAQVLLGLAEQEGPMTIYSGMNLGDATALLEGFEEAYGLEPNYYRAASGDVQRRVLFEVDAGYVGNDLVILNGPEMTAIEAAGALAPLRSVATEAIFEGGVGETYATVYQVAYIAVWNSDLVSAPPATWEELFTTFEGTIAFEIEDWPWFAMLTMEYFVPRLGMTEDEVVDMFLEVARRSRVIDGHTLMTELLQAGEFDAAASAYHHRVTQFRAEGAPLAWEQPLEPIITRTSRASIMRHVQAPATALLFLEWLLTDGQEILATQGRSPASTAVDGGIPREYEVIPVDDDALALEREKWEGLWADIVQEAGQDVG